MDAIPEDGFHCLFPKVLCIILSKQKTYFRQGRLAWN